MRLASQVEWQRHGAVGRGPGGGGQVSNLLEGLGTDQKVCPSAGNEAHGVVAGLHVLPEVDVGVVEDVGVHVEVVEALRRQHHGHVVPTIE